MTRRGLDLKAPLRARDVVVGLVALGLSIALVVLGTTLGRIHSSKTHLVIIAWACAILLLLTGTIAIRRITADLGRLVTHRSYVGAGAIVRLVTTGASYVVLLFALFGVLGVSVSHLLIGAGVAGVVIGIAAQQSLANVFASLVLLFARPFVVGENIRIRSGVLGVIDVEVLGIGLTYVTVRTEDGILKVPNSVLLASGIGQTDPKSHAPHAATNPSPSTSSDEQPGTSSVNG
jgi:small-conductance mechanosensitive channel